MWKLALFHTFYLGSGRAASQFPLELGDRFRRTLRQDLDIPVREVPGHSGEAQARTHPSDEPTEANALHHAVNQEPCPRHPSRRP
ncbi:MAG TPA: hypothetical protein VH113_06535 [Gemmatimonadales bacterium]|nr:hypothetical protein [Gemmatimonadales bacterium]